MSEYSLQHNEVRPGIDSNDAFFVLGHISELVLRIKETNNLKDLNVLRVFLASTTLPLDTFLIPYLQENGKADIANSLKDEHDENHFFYVGYFKGLRTRNNIQWYVESDPLLRECLMNSKPLDSDSICQVSYRFGCYHVRWILPEPEVFWECQNPDDLIYLSMIVVEELLHLSQLRGNNVMLHTLGSNIDVAKVDSSSMDHHIIQKFITKLMESDVTQIFCNAFPKMKEECWKWYSDRQNDPKHEKHYPLSIDWAFLLGNLTTTLLDTINEDSSPEKNSDSDNDLAKEFFVRSMIHLPEHFMRFPEDRNTFFSNYAVLEQIATFLSRIYDNDQDERISHDQKKGAIEHQLSLDGITRHYLIYCKRLKENNKEKWQDILDKGNIESDQHGTHFGTKILQMLKDYFNQNPKYIKQINPNVDKNNLESIEELLEIIPE